MFPQLLVATKRAKGTCTKRHKNTLQEGGDVRALRVTTVGVIVEVAVDALGAHGGGAVGHEHVAHGVGAEKPLGGVVGGMQDLRERDVMRQKWIYKSKVVCLRWKTTN